VSKFIEPSLSDVPRLSTFLREAWKEAGPDALGWTGATDSTIQEIASDAFLTALLTRPGTRILVAEDANDIIGLAVLRRLESTLNELAGIVLRESRTGKGVGGSLLEAILERSQADGVEEVVVHTETSNGRALEFYQRHGFVVEGHRQEEIGGTKVDLATLRRKLRGRTGIRS
jgi:ribosomal protein S18 acetylase RimI-like enzyme